MATRQYIGARYVPKFADPIEWQNNTRYEGLTIVTYNGNSYTSKKPVPPGINPSNSSYWANTGNFNAQLQSLSEQVTETNERVDEFIAEYENIDNFMLSGRKILIYGDSNSDQQASVSSQELQPNWVSRFIEQNPDVTVVNRSITGRRISGAAGIASMIDSATDLDEFDTLIVFGGVNDWQHSVPLGNAGSTTVDTVIGAMNVINTKVNADNKRMMVYFISPLKTYRASDQMPSDYNELMRLQLYRIAIKKCCEAYNWNYIAGEKAPRLNTGVASIRNAFIVDGLHMANGYASIFAQYITKALVSERNDEVGDFDCLIDMSSLVDTNRWTVNYCRLIIKRDGSANLLLSVVGTFTTASTLITLPEPFRPSVVSQGHCAIVENNVYTIANCSMNTTGGVAVQSLGEHTGTIVTDLRYNIANLFFQNTGTL